MHVRPERDRVSSQADLALAGRDRALPGLVSVLDAGGLAREAGLDGLRPAYLRYKPGTSCTAGLVPAAGGLGAWMAVTVPPARFDELARRPKWRKRGAVVLPERHALFVPLAGDRKLRGARRLADPDRRRRLLKRLGLENAHLSVLRYKPGRRLVLRADGPEGPRAVIKLHARARDWDAALAGARFCEAAGGPAIVGISERDRAIAVAWVAGDELGADAPSERFRLAGLALAAAHARPLAGDLRRFLPPDTGTAIRAIAALDPDLGAVARGLPLPDLPGGAPCSIHGDFSADQVVVGPQGARIVDWDRAAVSPPARDLGSALARLDLDEIRGADVAAAAHALLEGYAALRPLPPREDIAAHRAHALLALATEGFRSRRPDWNAELQAVLARIAAPPSLPDVSPIPIAGLGPALDPDRLRPVFGLPPDAPLGVAPTRLKPGRRAMIRVTLPDGAQALGKIRARRPDRTAPALQHGLRIAGLDGRSGVEVPKVIATPEGFPAWFQAAVPGVPLGEVLEAADGVPAVERAGRALAALHATPPQTDRRWTRDDELRVLEKAVDSGPHAHLADLVRHRLASLGTAPEVGLHRDFYQDQVLIGADTVWLVDLDLHARGDAAIDIGNFLAHLTELALRRGRPLAWSDRLGEAFLGGYASAGPLPEAERTDAFHWMSLARHVSIAERFADRRHTIPAIAALCRARLADQRARAAM
jgi:Ser/Thr protein kinase RdoA (MazF antagonist)